MKDAIDLFYDLSELFEDDLYQIAMALKRAGAREKPSRIYEDIENLNVKKYVRLFDKILKNHRGLF